MSIGADVIATWIEPVSGDVHRVRFSTLQGTTGRWSEPATVTESEDVLASSVDFPIPARAVSGDYYTTLLMQGREPHASHVHLARSSDGSSWSDLGPVHGDGTETEHGHASLFRDGPDLRAVWLDGRGTVDGGPMAIRTALIDPLGELGQSEILDPRVCDCCQTAGAATPAGAFVAYRDRGVTETRDIAVVRRGEPGWTSPEIVHADGWSIRGCPINGPQVAARGRELALAWYTAPEGGASVRLAFSEDAGATFGLPVEVDVAAPAGRVDVMWADEDSALVAWLGTDHVGGPINVRVRRVSRDRRLGAVVDVALLGGARAVGVPRLASWGTRALIAWTEAGPPRRVRASAFDPLEVPEPTGAASRAPVAVRASGLELGTPLPDVAVSRVDGSTALQLGAMRRTPTIVSFFASWCEPCRDEFPLLSRLAREHGDALHVVGISIDEAPASRVAEFAREHSLSYLVAHDADGAAARAFGVPPIPATFVFDRQGELSYRHLGGGAELLEGLPRAVTAVLQSPEEHSNHGHGHGHGH